MYENHINFSTYCNFYLQLNKLFTMTAYTGVTLDKFSKREIIGMASSLQNKVEAYKDANTDVLEEIRKFNENFVTLKTKINLVKKVNTLLNKRVVDVERQCWTNAQYSRRECLEVAGIPHDFSIENLESKVLEVFNKVGCEIHSSDIEAFHLLTNSIDRIMVKFS